MQLYAVSGNPVYHSKSPLIFKRHFAAKRIDACYLRYAAVDANDIISFIHDMPLCGMNVTAPFKTEIFSLIENCDESAASIGAVNTLANREGRLYATCTDPEGVLRPLRRRTPLDGAEAVVIGAGGAARAAVYALVSAGSRVTVVNRSFEKAHALADEFGAQAAPLSADAITKLFAENRIIVHTLPHGASLPVLPQLRNSHIILDANYHDSIYLDAVRDAAAILIPGEEWLYEQADAASRFMGAMAIDDPHTSAYISAPRDNRKKHIALTGFMGCGKTTIGERLSAIGDFPLYDLDTMIEREASLSVSEIFEKFGESHFRDLESQMLARVLDLPRGIVSCGGGIIEREANRALLDSAHTVWLYASVDALFRRISACGEARPLAHNSDDFQKRYERRVPLYAASSDLVISSTGDVDAVARRIYAELYPFL